MVTAVVVVAAAEMEEVAVVGVVADMEMKVEAEVAVVKVAVSVAVKGLVVVTQTVPETVVACGRLHSQYKVPKCTYASTDR